MLEFLRRNGGQLADGLLDHVVLTSLAIGVGFALSVILTLLIVRWRGLGGPIMAATGTLYTIPSLALFAFLVPITGLSLLTAEIGLISYTLLILVRNTLAGIDGVPPDVREAADGSGTRGCSGCSGSSCRWPCPDLRRPPDRDRDHDRSGDGHRSDRRGRPGPGAAARASTSATGASSMPR